MKISFIRYSENDEATASIVLIDGEFFSYGLEDQAQEQKVKGETRIPEGTYQLAYRMIISPKTEQYRARFPWFKYHLHLQNVPGFKYVYIHIGNDDDDTDGCLLVGDSINNLSISPGFLASSTTAFKRLYTTVKEAIDSGESCFVEITSIKGVRK